MLLPILVACFCVIFVFVFAANKKASQRSHLPPSPRGLPVLGHALQLPSKFLFRKLGDWQKQLGGIYSLSAAGQTIVVIGDAQIAVEILDRMSAVSSGRPSFPMNKLMSRGMEFAMATYGDRWRQHRRIAQENFNVRTATAYRSILERGAADLVQSIAGSQSPLYEDLLNAGAKTVWRALYGEPSNEYRNHIKRLTRFTSETFQVSSPSGSLVNIFPFLLRLPKPVNPWKQYADERYERLEAFGLNLIREGSGSGSESGFVSSCIKAREKNSGLTDPDIAFTAMTLFGAGSETVTSATQSFILAMVLHPSVLRDAQRIVDSVVGNRLPTFEDRPQLPYVDALIAETLRWRSPTPLGLPHLATEDFEYDGYLIPKGASLIPNIWYMNHDPAVFPDPQVFRPERFLDDKGQLRFPPHYHDGTISFGYGRRMCPGKEFAGNEMFINIAYLLWSFDFVKARDEQGREVTPDPDALVDDILLAHPCPFPCTVEPRKDLGEAFLGVL